MSVEKVFKPIDVLRQEQPNLFDLFARMNGAVAAAFDKVTAWIEGLESDRGLHAGKINEHQDRLYEQENHVTNLVERIDEERDRLSDVQEDLRTKSGTLAAVKATVDRLDLTARNARLARRVTELEQQPFSAIPDDSSEILRQDLDYLRSRIDALEAGGGSDSDSLQDAYNTLLAENMCMRGDIAQFGLGKLTEAEETIAAERDTAEKERDEAQRVNAELTEQLGYNRGLVKELERLTNLTPLSAKEFLKNSKATKELLDEAQRAVKHLREALGVFADPDVWYIIDGHRVLELQNEGERRPWIIAQAALDRTDFADSGSGEVVRLRKQLSDAYAEHNGLTEQLNAVERELSETKVFAQAGKSGAAILESDLNNAKAECEMLRQQIGYAEAECEGLRERADDTSKWLRDKVAAQLANTREENDRLRAQLESARAIYVALRELIGQLNDDIADVPRGTQDADSADA